jgi:acyl-CoA synthetase (NDP forming)
MAFRLFGDGLNGLFRSLSVGVQMISVRQVMESRNVAVIGASQDPEKPGALVLKVLKDTGFQGQVAGVNPRGGEVHGMPLYHSLDEIPFPVDLAVLIIPPKAVPPSLAECASQGVKGVVISSEGFAETGEEGKRYQEEVRSILRSTGMRGFGPNTMGIVNTATGLTTSYFASKRMLQPGPIGFASQSGIFLGALMRYLTSFEPFRISKVLGLGNKVDVDESDALSYLIEDEQTRIVGMYLEDIRDGRRFLDVARKGVVQKPVLLLKGGRTPTGSRATASHTASLAVDDAVLNGALRQAGVLRMADMDELVSTIMGFQCMPLPKGERLAFVTYSGAQAIMSMDVAADEGLQVARLSKEAQKRIASVIAMPNKAQNPVDVFPDMMAYGFEKTATEILHALLDDDGVHGIVFISFATYGPDPYRPLVEVIRNRLTKPIFFALLGDKNKVAACRELMEQNGIPFYMFPEMAIRVFAHMWRYARTLKGARGRRSS